MYQLFISLLNVDGNIDAVISVSVDIENELAEADAYFKALEVEYRSIMTGDRRAQQNRINECRVELKTLTDSYKTAKFEAEQQAQKNGSVVRSKLTSNNQKLDESTRKLESSRMVVAQTEEVGNVILSDLESQREQLQGAHDQIQDTKSFTAKAKQILTTMGHRAVIHKVTVWIIIILLFGVICIMIYYGFMKKK